MADKDAGLFDSAPEAVFYLVSDGKAVGDLASGISSDLDDQPGVQVTLNLDRLPESALFDELLGQAKVGSRWGKDLSAVYREFLQDRIDQVDEVALVDEFEAQFSRYDADPYGSGVIGDAMSIGIDVADQIQKALDKWENQELTKDDLAAAVGIAARSGDLVGQQTVGGIIFQSTEPLSSLDEQKPLIQASQNLQQLLLAGLDVAIIAPVGSPNEEEKINSTFRGIGAFSIETLASGNIDITEPTATSVDEWYDRLRYDVADNRVVENVVRPASVTAYDLPDELWSLHFRRAITVGLQNAYSEKSFNEERFDNLWEDEIVSHANYDQYRSRRNSFPTVKVARKDDGRRHSFELRHRGPSAIPYIGTVPIQNGNPEKQLVEWIKRYLDAETVTEERWQALVASTEEIATSLQTTAESVVENALLLRNRKRKALTPQIPPENQRITDGIEISESEQEEARPSEWYERHWSTILADFEITKQGGVGAIERKVELQRSLNPDREADEALYYKLERDINNAWDHFTDGIETQLMRSLPDDQNVSIEQRETRSGQELTVTVAPEGGSRRTSTIEILLPYSEVSVDGSQIRPATITNTVNDVIDTLGTTLREGGTLTEDSKADLLYEITKAYSTIGEFEEGDLVYFDDIVEFCLSLPKARSQFESPDHSAEPTIRELLGSERYMDRVRDSVTTFHRKGSDRHGSVRTNDNRYIAMELQDTFENHHADDQ